jgi:hypothetical protein
VTPADLRVPSTVQPPCRIDHLTVTAPTLAAGAEFVRRALGVTLGPGGTHARMGTHNLLLRLGDTTYLEVIAVDPDAVAPQRPRWFGLDHLGAHSPARLATWVARTADIGQRLATVPEALGLAEPMARGDLQWLIAIPPDGSLPLGGVAPALIEWQGGSAAHPASRMPDLGCALQRLSLFHPEPARVAKLLDALGLADAVDIAGIALGQAPFIVAHIATPDGPRSLGGPAD